MDEPRVELRPEGAADEQFLLELYASTRSAELAPLGWAPEAERAFVAQQFAAQRAHHRAIAAAAPTTFDVVLVDGRAAGRLYVSRGDDELRVVDVALLPEHRGRGIGTALLRGVLEEARAAGKAASLAVARDNPALRLYRRLGFEPVADDGVYVAMRRRPDAAAQLKTAS